MAACPRPPARLPAAEPAARLPAAGRAAERGQQLGCRRLQQKYSARAGLLPPSCMALCACTHLVIPATQARPAAPLSCMPHLDPLHTPPLMHAAPCACGLCSRAHSTLASSPTPGSPRAPPWRRGTPARPRCPAASPAPPTGRAAAPRTAAKGRRAQARPRWRCPALLLQVPVRCRLAPLPPPCRVLTALSMRSTDPFPF